MCLRLTQCHAGNHYRRRQHVLSVSKLRAVFAHSSRTSCLFGHKFFLARINSLLDYFVPTMACAASFDWSTPLSGSSAEDANTQLVTVTLWAGEAGAEAEGSEAEAAQAGAATQGRGAGEGAEPALKVWMFEGETLLDTIPYTPAPSIVLTGLMRIRPIHDFQTGFPTHPVGPPHSARFRASRVVHYLEKAYPLASGLSRY